MHLTIYDEIAKRIIYEAFPVVEKVSLGLFGDLRNLTGGEISDSIAVGILRNGSNSMLLLGARVFRSKSPFSCWSLVEEKLHESQAEIIVKISEEIKFTGVKSSFSEVFRSSLTSVNSSHDGIKSWSVATTTSDEKDRCLHAIARFVCDYGRRCSFCRADFGVKKILF